MILVLSGLVLFQIKHYVFDFPLQTQYQLRNKGTYGHFGGILHAGLHGTGSILPLYVMHLPIWLIALLIAGEFVAHYHVDWTKEQILRRTGWTPEDFGYWQALGIDQMIHHLTYAAMLAAAAYDLRLF